MDLIATVRTLEHCDFTSEELFELLQSPGFDVEVYVFEYPTGMILASSKTWKVVGKIETVLAILAATAGLYDVAKPEDEPTMSIRVENARQDSVIYYNGSQLTTLEKQVEQVHDSVELLKAQIDLELTKRKLESLRKHPLWKQVK